MFYTGKIDSVDKNYTPDLCASNNNNMMSLYGALNSQSLTQSTRMLIVEGTEGRRNEFEARFEAQYRVKRSNIVEQEVPKARSKFF